MFFPRILIHRKETFLANERQISHLLRQRGSQRGCKHIKELTAGRNISIPTARDRKALCFIHDPAYATHIPSVALKLLLCQTSAPPPSHPTATHDTFSTPEVALVQSRSLFTLHAQGYLLITTFFSAKHGDLYP